MKTTREFLADLIQQNIRLWVAGDQLRLRVPEGGVTDDLIQQLQARKAEILDFLRRSAHKVDRPPIESMPRREPLPLSYAQQRLWFLDQLEGPSSTYNIPWALRLSGALQIAALEQALNVIVQRHDVLRTTFPTQEGEPVQSIAPDLRLPLAVVDIQHMAASAQLAELNRLLDQEAERPFDLARGPLLRATLYVMSSTEHVLLINKHHIISDGWSLGIWWRELEALYCAFSVGEPSPLPALPLQYADFAQWQRQWLTGEVLEKQLAYWRQQLADAPTLLELPTDHPRPAVQTFNGQTKRFEIAPRLAEHLQDFSRRSGTSLFMTLYAAFAVLLSRYSGQGDIVVGTSIANRHYQELEPLIGFFVNTLALRTELSENPRFDELLQQVRQVTLDAYAHQDIPFEQLAEELDVERSLSHPPLFQVMFELQNAVSEPTGLGDLHVKSLDVGNVTAKFDLNVMLYEGDPTSGGGLRAEFEYSTDLFEPATIHRMIGHYQQLLTGIVANPAERINTLPLLTEAERHQLLVEWNDTSAACPTDTCFHQLFEAQVERTPNAVAVVDDRASFSPLTYRELNERANQLAHQLRILGVQPEQVVGARMARGADIVISLLAIFKAGGVYMPLDPTLPVERLDYMLSNARASVVLTQSEYAATWSPQQVHIVCLDTDCEIIARQPTSNPVHASTPKHLAYVSYTSGSTGLPKGAMVGQQGMVNHLYTKIIDLSLTEGDRVAETAPLSFDISIWQFLSALLVGGAVHIFDDETVRNPAQLLDLTEAHQITILEVVPSLLRYMLDELSARSTERPDFTALRWLLLTGEALPPHLCQEWFNHYPNIPQMNAYGPTECSDDVTHHAIYEPLPPNVVTVPIGRAVANMRLYILNHQLQPTPIGVPGELYVGGIGVGRGYLNDPERTATAFMSDPFVPGPEARFYKTGDLVRYRSDGAIEFLGRLDHQIKIRGHRIELGEIETVLGKHPEVRQTLVIAHEKVASDDTLVAYLVPLIELGPAVPELRQYLSQTLPDYMIPAHFVSLPALPLTPNGKIDRNALPIPEETGVDEGYDAPHTPAEDVLAAIWAEVLELERVGRHGNFFELGGHSLLAIRVISRLREAFQVELSVRTVFEAPTIAELASAIEIARRIDAPLPILPSMQPVGRHRDLPLSFAQQRLWFLDELEGPSPIYNIPMAFQLTGHLHLHGLEYALNEIVRRHEGLRTTFPSVKGRPAQYIQPGLTLPLPVEDLEHLTGPGQTAELHRRLTQEAGQPFDLAQGPLLRMNLYVLSETEHVLLINMHHIISDDWSMRILLNELNVYYRAAVHDEPADLPELPLQYADFAHWQRQWLTGEVLDKQLMYWQQLLAEAPTRLELPTDHPRPLVQTFNGRIEYFEIDAQLAEPLRALGRRTETSSFMVFYAVFAVLMSRYSHQEDLVIGTPIANRQYREVESLIGFFLNTLALRTDLSGQPSFEALLVRVRQLMLDVYAHQDIPFEQLVSELSVERNLSHTPLFQVMFVWLDALEPLRLGDVQMTPLELSTVVAKFDLTLLLEEMTPEAGGGLGGMIEYNIDLFEPDTIRRMISHFQCVLRGVVSNSTQPVNTLPLLTEAERQQLLVEWNDTQAPYPADRCFHQLFEAQAQRVPQTVAVMLGEQQLTYHELNTYANQLAHHLQALGVGSDVLVGLCVERSLDMAVGLLAILKAGGAYVPLDPAYPSERLTLMLADAQVKVLLTQACLDVELVPPPETPILYLDTMSERWAAANSENPAREVQPEHLVYVIYTSGSTGQPKAVAMPHRPMVNMIWWQLAHTRVSSPGARTLQFAPLSFDVSFQEMFATWCAGGTLVLIDEDMRRDAYALLAYLQEQRIERLFLPFVALQALAESMVRNAPPATLKEVNTAGEQLQITPAIVQWFDQVDCTLNNHYGPTETHAISSYTLEGPPHTWPFLPPVGRPISNMEVYLLDASEQPVPLGVVGELYAGGGDCLARGYWRQPELTAERFIDNPFGSGRLYKTGDLARYLPDGMLEFLGRADDQVKIRGFRVELGEIEVVLNQHPVVQDAVVVARETGRGLKQLVAYVVSRDPRDPSTALRHFLREKLPDYMVPAAFVLLDNLPLTSSGKVNRRALPEPEYAGLEAGYTSPHTPTEEVLIAIWTEVLDLDAGRRPVGIHDNFFNLGGHSLLATQIVSRLREAFQIALPVRTLFESPTVAELATAIEAVRQADRPLPPPMLPVKRDGDAPLSFAQQRLWVLAQMTGSSPTYNLPLGLRLSGSLQVNALERALNEIVVRHAILRTTFPVIEGQPVQRLQPSLNLPLSVVDLQYLDGPEQQAELDRLLAQEAVRLFDLSEGPLLRVVLYVLAAPREGRGDYALFLNMHHIIADGWSMGVLWQELDSLYQAFTAGQPSPLPELAIQYTDFAQWQRQWLQGDVLDQQVAYWQYQLADAPTLLELPTDRPRPGVQTFNGQTEHFEIEPSLADQLRRFSRCSGASLFMVLYGAFSVLLSRYSGQEDVVIGTPIANRNYREIEPLIGFFINMLPLRTDLSGNPSFEELLIHVRQVTLDAYAHQDIPFEQLLGELEVERQLSHTPLFQVVIMWQNVMMEPEKVGDLDVSLFELDTSTTKFDLTLVLGEDDIADGTSATEGLWGGVEYNSDLFEPATIQRLIGHFRQLLHSIVTDPTQPVQTLPMLTEAECHQLLVEWNATQADYSCSQLVHQLVEVHAEQRPEASAVVYPTPGANLSLTYRELNQRANQLAHYLRRLGVGPGAVVAVYMERSLDMLVAYLAILKAGGAYTPIDASYPVDRVAFILADTQAPVLLSHTQLAPSLSPSHCHVLCPDRDWPQIAQESMVNPENVASLETLAYIIYTSGSTGQPKGSQIAHRSLLNFIFWYQGVMAIEATDRIPQLAGVSFDASVSDIWPCLAAGAALYFPQLELLHNPLQLRDWIVVNGITKSFIVTPIAEYLLHLEWPPETAMTICMTGGDKLHRVSAPHHPFKFYNAYGPSECTIMSVFCQVPPREQTDVIPPIGRPVANTELYILDGHLQPVPIGIYGELHIGGDCLGRGYLNRPDLTEERFIPHPFRAAEGARLYKTGDLVRYLPNGEIEFWGRTDDQVKLRGYRIELGEIETVLAGHPQVEMSTVLVWDSGQGASDKRLVAYVAAKGGELPTAAILRAYLKKQLPEYMIPSAFVPLESLPLTANGKVDRRALPEPDRIQSALSAQDVSPRTDLEKTIAAVWQARLHLEKVAIHDNFFEVGGHSLIAIEMYTDLQERLAQDFAVTDLFRYPTIALLAQYLSQTQAMPPSQLSNQNRAQARRAAIKQRATRQLGRVRG